MSLTLANALRIKPSDGIAFIGSGGKTTAIFQLARQIESPVIVAATSHLGTWQVSMADKHIVASPHVIREIENDSSGVILVTGPIDGGKTKPIDDDLLRELHQFCINRSIPLLIEADGSRQKPLKAWAEHEPPIPDFVNHVVHVVGLIGLGKPLGEDFVHRPELFSDLSGLNIDGFITSDALIRVLNHKKSGLKNIPADARRSVLLNQADTPELQASARGMAEQLLSSFDSVVISSLAHEQIFAVHEPVAGIILAAGESARYGQPKQLLDWKGEPFVRVTAKRALEAGLSPVVVITGANAERVETAIQDLNVRVVRNSEWKNGQASSIRTALDSFGPPPPFGHLPQIRRKTILDNQNTNVGFGGGWEGVGAAIFLLVDQPHITTSILHALVEKHAEGLYPIVAPMVMDHRANPVLFDRATFPDMLTLEGDVGGRAIFHKHKVEYLPWHDDRLLLDVDTPEQYQRLLADESL
jgi:molybdenum cofactor cytidylyltransferase